MSTPSETHDSPDGHGLHPSHVPSPYLGQMISKGLHVRMNAYWFGTNFHWAALLLILLPEQIGSITPQFRAGVLGLITGLSALVALTVPLVVGALSDRCGHRWGRRRPYMVAGVFTNIVGLGVMAAAYAWAMKFPLSGATNQWQAIFGHPPLLVFFLGFLLVQFGNNVASGSFMGMIPDLVPEDQRGAASGWYALMTQVGTLAGALVMGVVLGEASETVKYFAVCVILLLSLAGTFYGVKETPHTVKQPPIRWGPYIRSLWIDPRKFPDFAWVWITRFLVVMGFEAVKPFIPYYLGDVINIPVKEVSGKASILLAIILFFSVGSAIIGGIWSDRVGRKRIVYIANSGIVVFTLAFIFCRNLPLALFVGALFGVCYGAYISVDYAMGTDVLPTKGNAGKEMAVWHVAMTLPQTIATPAAGALIEAFGQTKVPGGGPHGEDWYRYTSNGYAAVFVVAAVCFALGAYFLKNVKGVK